jgi:capsular exopolysaccharide synthesis family protein
MESRRKTATPCIEIHRMSENLPTHVGSGPPPTQDELGPSPYDTPFSLRDFDDEGSGFLAGLLPAFKRFWWIFAIATAVGGAAAFLVFQRVPLGYQAEGTIWIQNESAGSDGPIVQGGLLNATAWEELLTSFEVLDPVVTQERLYLQYAPADSLVFQEFALEASYLPGNFVLTVGPDGREYVLSSEDRVNQVTGTLGGPLGGQFGFSWQPAPGSLLPEQEVEFSVVTPRDAARSLQTRLRTNMDRQGNFLAIQLDGAIPVRLASVINGVMLRFVDLAAELKRSQSEQLMGILETQLARIGEELRQAEQALTSYQVRTATLPSEETAPVVPGLEQTTNTVFGEYQNLRLQLDQLSRDRRRLEAAVARIDTDGLQVEAFEMIEPVQRSTPIMGALSRYTDTEATIAALRETYFDDYGPLADQIQVAQTLEQTTIPAYAESLLEELRGQEADLGALIDSRADELERIPPRVIQEANLQRDYVASADLYQELSRRFEEARLAAASSIPDVQVLDEAVVPQVPSGDLRYQFAAAAFFIPLGLSVLLVMLLDRLDTRLRDPSQIGGELGLDWLATIPRYRPASVGRDNAEEIREAFRDLRMKIDYAFGAARPLLISITSPSEGEGKTFVSANLATAFADLGRKTVLVDGDTRRGDLHHIIGRERKPGLTDFLMNGANHQVIQETDNQKLHFIGFGTRTPSSPELLTSSQMQSLLAGLKRRYEVIIIDSPPMAAGSDAYVLGAHAGSVLTVLRSGTTNRELAAVQMESFLRLPVRLLGAVLNDFTPQLGQGYYRYYSHYLPGYEASEEEDE